VEVHFGDEEKKEVVSSDPCAICMCNECDTLLQCGHAFHLSCLEMQLKTKWTGVRISFDFLGCAICRQRMKHSSKYLAQSITDMENLEVNIQKMAVEKAKEEDITNGLEGNELLEHAMKVLAYYMCVQCQQPFCGGLVSCAADIEIDTSSLRCQSCIFQSDAAKNKDEIPDLKCKIHGYKSAMFKCDSCCSIATYDCIYNHYCDRCHGQASAAKDYPCPGPDKCPLGIRHPPNEAAVHCSQPYPVPFVIGCMKCVGFEEENQIWGGAPHVF